MDDVDLAPSSQWLADLPADLRAEVLACARPLHVAAGDWLVRQNDPADVFYVVQTGRLELIVEYPPPARVVGQLAPGDVLGELALVTGENRSASVRAKRASLLLAVDREPFEDVLRRNAQITRSLLAVVAHKLRQAQGPRSSADPPARTVCVASLVPGLDAAVVGRALTASVEGRLRTHVADLENAERWANLDALERHFDLVVLAAPPSADELRDCIDHADRTLLVGDRAAAPPPDPTGGLLAGCDLVLVGVDGSVRPWLDAYEPRAHHLVDTPDDPVALARVARRVTGTAVGVVLSGGGARGLAHLGVVAELLEAGLQIDRYGGCSMGALIAALLATGRSVEEAEALCRFEMVEQHPFRDYGLSRASLIRGRKAMAMLERLFGATDIEALPFDYFSVSADLASAALVVHRRGTLTTGVAASMSIPGLTPPVRVGDQMLVDGGVLDNLPVDVMAEAGEGPVIGVDVMGRRFVTRAQPTAIEVLARATVLGSWRWVTANEARADLIIRPEVADVGLLEFDDIELAIAAGRAAARTAIDSGQLKPHLS